MCNLSNLSGALLRARGSAKFSILAACFALAFAGTAQAEPTVTLDVCGGGDCHIVPWQVNPPHEAYYTLEGDYSTTLETNSGDMWVVDVFMYANSAGDTTPQYPNGTWGLLNSGGPFTGNPDPNVVSTFSLSIPWQIMIEPWSDVLDQISFVAHWYNLSQPNSDVIVEEYDVAAILVK